MTTRRNRAARPVTELPPPVEEEKDPYLVGRFRFNPNWVHKEWSDGYFRWLVVISCALWYNLIFLPPRSVFHEIQDWDYVYVFVFFDYFCDILYLMDIGMRILTGYLENGILIKEPRKLFNRYIHGPHLKWDVLSIIPTDIIFVMIPVGWHAPAIFLRANRLLKIGRVGEFQHRALTRLDSPNTFRLIYLILKMVVIVHLNACLYYGVSYLNVIGMDRWTYPAKAGWRYEKVSHGGGGHGGGGGGHGEAGAHGAASGEHGAAGHDNNNDTVAEGLSHNPFSNDTHGSVESHGSDHPASGAVHRLAALDEITAHVGSGKHDMQPAAHTDTGNSDASNGHSTAANEADLQDNAGGSKHHPPPARHRRQVNYVPDFTPTRRSYYRTTDAPTTTTIEHLTGNLFPLPPDVPVGDPADPHNSHGTTSAHGDPDNAHGTANPNDHVKTNEHGTASDHGETNAHASSGDGSGHESSGHGEATAKHGTENGTEHVTGKHETNEHGTEHKGGEGEHGGDAGAHGGAGGEHKAGGEHEAAAGGHHGPPMRFSEEFINDTVYQKYSYCMYWSVKMMTSKPYEISNPQTTAEFIFHLFDAFVGILLFASIVGEVDGIIESINKKSDEFKEHLDSVKQYISMRKVGKEMETRVVKWFDYIWSNNGSLNEESVLTVLPEKLRMEIAKHVHLAVLKKVPIFQGIDDQFLLELAEKLKFEAFCPGDYVCRRGDIGRHIYVVRRGLLNVIAADGVKVIVTLKSGVVFGELSLLNVPGSVHGNRRTVTVRSVGYADLYSLSKEDFWVSLEEYPEVKDQLMEKAKKILQKDNLVNEDVAREQARRGRNFQAVADRMEESLETVNTRMDRFWQEQIEINQRLIKSLDQLDMRNKKEETAMMAEDKKVS